VNELKRIKEPTAWKPSFRNRRTRGNEGDPRSPRLPPETAQASRGIYPADEKHRQLGGVDLGCKACVGMENLGQMVPVTNVISDMSENTDLILFWGCDRRPLPWGWSGQLAAVPVTGLRNWD